MDDLNLEANLDNLEDEQEDKTSKENEEEEDNEDEDEETSVVIQKKKWREKAKKTEEKLAKTEAQLAKAIEKKENVSEDEAEKKAKDYIKGIVSSVIKDEKEKEKEQEQKEQEKFNTKLEEIIDDNPEYTKKELEEVCDELGCSPEQGIKVLKRQDKKSPRKPKMPVSKQPSGNSKKEDKEPETDMYKVAEQVKQKLRDKV